MQIQFEQLLNLPDIQILNVEITEHEIKCGIESTRGFSICRCCGQKATKFFEHGETLTLRHLPICENDVYFHLRTNRYRCLVCGGEREPEYMPKKRENTCFFMTTTPSRMESSSTRILFLTMSVQSGLPYARRLWNLKFLSMN